MPNVQLPGHWCHPSGGVSVPYWEGRRSRGHRSLHLPHIHTPACLAPGPLLLHCHHHRHHSQLGYVKYLYTLKLFDQKYDGQIFTSSHFQVCAAQRRYSGMLAVSTSTPSTSCSLRGRSVSTCWWRGTRRSSSSASTLCSELRCDNLDGVGVHRNGGDDAGDVPDCHRRLRSGHHVPGPLPDGALRQLCPHQGP